MRKIKSRIVTLVLCLLATSLSLAGIEIKARINAKKIGIEDHLYFSITFVGVSSSKIPTVPEIKDFKIRNPSTGITAMGNSVAMSYTYALKPLKTGVLEVPPFTCEHNGRKYNTPSFRVTVVKGSISSPGRQENKPDAETEASVRLVTEISKQEALIGEPVSLSVLLLVPETGKSKKGRFSEPRVKTAKKVGHSSVSSCELYCSPMNHFVKLKDRVVDGKNHTVYVITKGIFFAGKSGNIKTPLIDFELGWAKHASLFSKNNKNNYVVRKSARPAVLKVNPLPGDMEGLPVGTFSFEVRADRKTVNINDKVIFLVTVGATNGRIRLLEPPIFKNGEYYDVFAYGVKRKLAFKKEMLTGKVQRTLAVAFNKPGLVSFPPLEFKYVDPETKSIVSLKSKAFSISVDESKEQETVK
ncbi:MAG: protein BatD [bacterium]|nr:protein BatD [bacterium]